MEALCKKELLDPRVHGGKKEKLSMLSQLAYNYSE